MGGGGDWAGECFVKGLTEIQIMKYDNFIYQILPDGHLHRCVFVWWGGTIAVVFTQYFIIGQPRKRHIILWVHYYHITSFRANATAAVLIWSSLYLCFTLLLMERKFCLLSKDKVLDYFLLSYIYIKRLLFIKVIYLFIMSIFFLKSFQSTPFTFNELNLMAALYFPCQPSLSQTLVLTKLIHLN